MTSHKRSGFTILETLLVLAIMVTLFALSWPAIRGPLAKARLKGAARAVQTSLGKARAQAVEYGSAYAFRYQIDGGEFQILAWDALAARDSVDDPVVDEDPRFDSLEADIDSARDSDVEGASSIASLLRRPRSLPKISRTLPVGVRFVEETSDELLLDASPDASSLEADLADDAAAANSADSVGITEEGELEESSIRWSQPIIFWPNGRSQNARVQLRDERDYSISVDLRGLTGIASYGAATRPARADEVDAELPDQGPDEQVIEADGEGDE